jgi:hypothetical protein
VADDQVEHGVAEELEAFVRRVTRVLRAPRAVHERGSHEVGREVEPQSLEELRKVRDRKGDERS